MHTALSNQALAQLFADARTHNAWLPREVDDAQLRALYDTMKWAPTSANCSPARIVFVKSAQAKALLQPALAEGNRAKTMAAPVTAIVGSDYAFHQKLPYLFPHADAKSWFEGNQPMIDTTAFRNASLQGAYLIMAARAVGLDTGPMSGFDKSKVDAAFFAGTTVEANFICSVGHGTTERLFPRLPRLSFEEACEIL